MRLVSAFSIMVALTFGSAVSNGGGSKNGFVNINNEYGWRLGLPSCWRADGVEDSTTSSSAVVNIWLDECPQFKNGKWSLQITAHAHTVYRTSKDLYKLESEIARNNKRPEIETVTSLNGSKAKVLKSIYPSGSASWFMAFDCKEAISITIVGKVEEKTLQKIQLPAEIENVISKITCTKPKKG